MLGGIRDTRIPADPGVTVGGGLWVAGGRWWMVEGGIGDRKREKRERQARQETGTLPWLGFKIKHVREGSVLTLARAHNAEHSH